MNPILVTSYVDPDLDGVACIVGYAEFLRAKGKSAVGGVLGAPQDEARYVLDRFEIKYPQTINNADNFDEVILVDASDLLELEGKVAPEKVIEIIDHRKINQADKFKNAKAQIEMVGAAATLIAEKFISNNIEISKDSAILICSAIISNTLNFQAASTNDRDKKAYDTLNKIAQLPDIYWKELFVAKSDLTGDKLVRVMESDLALFEFGGKKIGIAQIEMIGVKKLLAERLAEITDELEKIRLENKLDFIFQNTVELEDGKNFYVANDVASEQLLERILGVKFNGNVAEGDRLMKRKQIVPLLAAELEK